LPFFFVHHTVSQECDDLTSCSARLRSIQNFHMNGRGWSDIGYSFLVGSDGRIYEGRGFNVAGAHTPPFNSRGYAVSFIGDFSAKSPTPAALRAAQDLILVRWRTPLQLLIEGFKCAKRKSKISSTYEVFGHRQTKNTACPGNRLYAIIQTWPRWVRMQCDK